MAARTGVNVRLGEEFKRTANALREVDSRLPAKLRKDMEKAVRPAVADAKAQVRSLPVQGTSGHTGLRRRVARGVKIQARTGKSPLLRVTTSMVERDEQNLPGYLDSPAGWRHPTFGHRDRWVHQGTGGSWFREPLADHREEIGRNLRQVLDDAAETIAAAGRG